MSATEQAWEPRFIDIEARLTDFASTFRGGSTISALIKDIPDGVLNADFYFSTDNVIAELKCLEADATEPMTYAQRVVACYRHFGYTGSDFFGWLFRGEPMPDRVARRLSTIISRSIVEAIDKANKQICSTKQLLGKPDARGLVLIANDRNLGFNPAQMMAVVCKTFGKLVPCHTDCIVYFTPNVYHDLGDGIAHTIWSTVYNVGSEDFADFVNNFGKAWGDHAETLGEPYVYREAGDDLFDKIALAQPIAQFRKP
jgi:hypothetical protein